MRVVFPSEKVKLPKSVPPIFILEMEHNRFRQALFDSELRVRAT